MYRRGFNTCRNIERNVLEKVTYKKVLTFVLDDVNIKKYQAEKKIKIESKNFLKKFKKSVDKMRQLC